MIERRGGPVSRLNLSPSSHFLLFESEAGSHPPAFRSANTALSSRFSISDGLSPASGLGHPLLEVHQEQAGLASVIHADSDPTTRGGPTSCPHLPLRCSGEMLCKTRIANREQIGNPRSSLLGMRRSRCTAKCYQRSLNCSASEPSAAVMLLSSMMAFATMLPATPPTPDRG